MNIIEKLRNPPTGELLESIRNLATNLKPGEVYYSDICITYEEVTYLYSIIKEFGPIADVIETADGVDNNGEPLYELTNALNHFELGYKE